MHPTNLAAWAAVFAASGSLVFAAAPALAAPAPAPAPAAPQSLDTAARNQQNGMREADVRWDALTNARVVVRPGQVIEDATVILRDGWIDAVGIGLPVPAGARVHDLAGKTLYAGFIDLNIPVNTATLAAQAASAQDAHWNPRVTPQVDAALTPIDAGVSGELRNLGFTAAVARPNAGIFRGESRVQLLESGASLGGTPFVLTAIDRAVGQGISLERGEFDWDAPNADARMRSVTFPGSQMGAIALVRQTLSDAAWATQAKQVWDSAPSGDTPPNVDSALLALQPLLAGDERVWLQPSDEQQLLRLAQCTNEAGIKAAALGTGLEFKRLDDVAAAKIDIVVPVAFPKAPEVADPRLAEQIPLGTLKEWAIAPANPALLATRLGAQGNHIALTTNGLESRNQFPERIRQAQEAGLTEDQVLAALTTDAAAMAGVADLMGTVEPGRMANLVVVEGGPLFGADTKVIDVWVAGRRTEVTKAPAITIDGECTLALSNGTTRGVKIDARKESITFLEPQVDEQGNPKDPKQHAASEVKVTTSRLTFKIVPEALGLTKVEGHPWGAVRCAAIVDDNTMHVEGTTLSGELVAFTITPKQVEAQAVAAAAPTTTDPATPTDKPAKKLLAVDPATVPITTPLGARGLESLPEQEMVVFANATVWTSGPQGILSPANVVVHNGKVVAVGPDAMMPGARVIDCTGKHLSPGMIDCHSHTGIEGGVNEFTQACTAEVRIGDVIDPDDVNWYWQLAGGTTAANQLHGSANPMGGQNSVVKARWGAGADDFPATGFKPGMKWALGENVVGPNGRYPDTRMGVEAYLRDRLTAAQQYRAAMEEWERNKGARQGGDVAPRRDLELEALAQIVAGERIVHCHSYRQDEILMLLRLAEDFHFRIGTLQHVLEGYKVAELIASHGAGASCFSDWWAYKMEVMDAIPYAGAIMHDQGVVVSFNSDSDELARRLNLECAKAVRYGGLEPADALCFTTINPAKQLGISQFTGSLEPGKDADLVVWSGDPLSTFTKCEQTWIDGACYFSLEKDAMMHDRDDALRTRLIAAAADADAARGGGDGGPPGEGRRGRGGRGRRGQGAGAPGGPGGPSTDTPPTLLSRMWEEREDAELERWRAGANIDQLAPANCGVGR